MADEKKCKSCAKMIPKEAKVCPYCRRHQISSRLVKAFFIILGLFIILPFYLPKTPSSSTTSIDSVDAYIMATKFAKQNLKHPHTASFAAHLQSDIKSEGDTWTVVSYVDSQNDFGASIRTNFACQMKHLGNKQWKLINIKTW